MGGAVCVVHLYIIFDPLTKRIYLSIGDMIVQIL